MSTDLKIGAEIAPPSERNLVIGRGLAHANRSPGAFQIGGSRSESDISFEADEEESSSLNNDEIRSMQGGEEAPVLVSAEVVDEEARAREMDRELARAANSAAQEAVKKFIKSQKVVKAELISKEVSTSKRRTPQQQRRKTAVFLGWILVVLAVVVVGVVVSVLVTRNKNKENDADMQMLRQTPTPTPISSTPWTSQLPTIAPSSRQPRRRRFETRNELLRAVDIYLDNLNEEQQIQQTRTPDDDPLLSPGISSMDHWDVSVITNFSSLFDSDRHPRAVYFNGNISSWNTSSATDMTSMFYAATSSNQPLAHWDVRRVTTFASMFYFASAFNQDIGTWSTSSAINMEWMFGGTVRFNQPLSDWNTGRVESFHAMFAYAASFNQPLAHWNVSSVRNATYMFQSATRFNQNLCAWRETLPVLPSLPNNQNNNNAAVATAGPMFLETSCPAVQETTPSSLDWNNHTFCHVCDD